jgi:hypothetical protein
MSMQPNDTATRLANAPAIRRVFARALTGFALGGVGSSYFDAVGAEASKRKRKARRKQKCGCPPPPPPANVPTCEEQCFPQFPLCYVRMQGAPLCANGAFTDGKTPCTTDQDCLADPTKPYCLVSETSRDTGSTSRFTTCEPYADGCCISVGVFP